MLDFSFGELVLIALVAILIVGPKDLPVVMRTVGRWVGQCKGIADEFRQGFKSAIEDSEFHEIGKDLHALKQEVKFIRDEQGNLQRVYDMPEFSEERSQSPPAVTGETPVMASMQKKTP